jgi:hypothetical protein
MISTYQVFPQPDDYSPSGITIDGAHFGLGGQPPVATSHGWGNMGWLRFRWHW